MAHPNIRKQQMLAWIEECLDANMPCPGDASICERFNLTSTESARTLLAELADAGRITIRGYGETRTITLGRQRGPAPSAPRPIPSVIKADAVVDAATARIVDIVQRGNKPARAIVAENAAKLLSCTTTPPAAPAVAMPAKESIMAGKTIQLPANATKEIKAVERLAKDGSLTLGQAAAQLIIQGLNATLVPSLSAAPSAERVVTFDSLRKDMATLFDDLVARADRPDQAADLAAAIERADAAEARAIAAEEKLAQFKALLA